MLRTASRALLVLALTASALAQAQVATSEKPQPDRPPLSTSEVLAGVALYPDATIEALHTVAGDPELLSALLANQDNFTDPAKLATDQNKPLALRAALLTLKDQPEALYFAASQPAELAALKRLLDESPAATWMWIRDLRDAYRRLERDATAAWEQRLREDDAALRQYRTALYDLSKAQRAVTPEFAVVKVTDPRYYFAVAPDEAVAGFASSRENNAALNAAIAAWWQDWSPQQINEKAIQGLLRSSDDRAAVIDLPAQQRAAMFAALPETETALPEDVVPVIAQPADDQPPAARYARAVLNQQRIWAAPPPAEAPSASSETYASTAPDAPTEVNPAPTTAVTASGGLLDVDRGTTVNVDVDFDAAPQSYARAALVDAVVANPVIYDPVIVPTYVPTATFAPVGWSYLPWPSYGWCDPTVFSVYAGFDPFWNYGWGGWGGWSWPTYGCWPYTGWCGPTTVCTTRYNHGRSFWFNTGRGVWRCDDDFLLRFPSRRFLGGAVFVGDRGAFVGAVGGRGGFVAAVGRNAGYVGAGYVRDGRAIFGGLYAHHGRDVVSPGRSDLRFGTRYYGSAGSAVRRVDRYSGGRDYAYGGVRRVGGSSVGRIDRDTSSAVRRYSFDNGASLQRGAGIARRGSTNSSRGNDTAIRRGLGNSPSAGINSGAVRRYSGDALTRTIRSGDASRRTIGRDTFGRDTSIRRNASASDALRRGVTINRDGVRRIERTPSGLLDSGTTTRRGSFDIRSGSRGMRDLRYNSPTQRDSAVRRDTTIRRTPRTYTPSRTTPRRSLGRSNAPSSFPWMNRGSSPSGATRRNTSLGGRTPTLFNRSGSSLNRQPRSLGASRGYGTIRQFNSGSRSQIGSPRSFNRTNRGAINNLRSNGGNRGVIRSQRSTGGGRGSSIRSGGSRSSRGGAVRRGR